MRIGGRFPIGYDSTVLAPISEHKTDITQHGFTAIQNGCQTSLCTISFTQDCIDAGDEIDAEYDSVLMVGITDDNGVTSFSATEGVDYFKIQMKVLDTAPAGDYTIGFNKGSYLTWNAYINDVNNQGVAADGGHMYSTTEDFGFGTATFKVASATEPSIIKDGGSQIRFRGISQTGTAADYRGEFDVRTVAKISEADFAAKFTDEATAIDKITDIGFVYARTSKVADFNLETAKAVAQGTPAAGYTKKQISHIQHTAGNDYQFTCLVENIQDADKTDSLNALAYVCFNGEWIFADAEIFADFTELYGRMPQ